MSDSDQDRATTSDVVRGVLRELRRLEPREARLVAALAFVLSRVAAADDGICDAELDRIEQVLASRGALQPEQAVLVEEIARHRLALSDCWTLYRVSREMRDLLDESGREDLLRCLWAVAGADGRVTPPEVGEIRQITVELGLPGVAPPPPSGPGL